MLQKGHHPTPFVELDVAPVAFDSASVVDSQSPDELDPEYLYQSKHIWKCQSGQLCRTNKVTCTFGLKQIPICAIRLFCKKLKRTMLPTLKWDWWVYIQYHEFSSSYHWRPLWKSSLHLDHCVTANDCRHSGFSIEIFVTAVHPFFLKAKSEASKEDNPNWRQAMNGPFVDNTRKQQRKKLLLCKEWVPGM